MKGLQEGKIPVQERSEAFSLEEMEDCLRASGLADADFVSERQKYAVMVRELFWELANIFSRSQGGSCELTHSEYLSVAEGEKEGIVLCMDFRNQDGEESSIQTFGDFVRDRIDLVPRGLRKMFNVYVGFNYGDRGGFLVSGDEVKNISQEEYNNLASGESIGYIRGKGEEIELFSQNLRNRILQKISN